MSLYDGLSVETAPIPEIINEKKDEGKITAGWYPQALLWECL